MKKLFPGNIIIWVLSALVILAISCENQGPSTHATCTITFELDGGTGLTSVTVRQGSDVYIPDYAPIKEGFDFMGFYSNPEFSGSSVGHVTVNSDMTFYARWLKSIQVPENITTVNGLKEFIENIQSDIDVSLHFPPCKISGEKGGEQGRITKIDLQNTRIKAFVGAESPVSISPVTGRAESEYYENTGSSGYSVISSSAYEMIEIKAPEDFVIRDMVFYFSDGHSNIGGIDISSCNNLEIINSVLSNKYNNLKVSSEDSTVTVRQSVIIGDGTYGVGIEVNGTENTLIVEDSEISGKSGIKASAREIRVVNSSMIGTGSGCAALLISKGSVKADIRDSLLSTDGSSSPEKTSALMIEGYGNDVRIDNCILESEAKNLYGYGVITLGDNEWMGGADVRYFQDLDTDAKKNSISITSSTIKGSSEDNTVVNVGYPDKANEGYFDVYINGFRYAIENGKQMQIYSMPTLVRNGEPSYYRNGLNVVFQGNSPVKKDQLGNDDKVYLDYRVETNHSNISKTTAAMEIVGNADLIVYSRGDDLINLINYLNVSTIQDGAYGNAIKLFNGSSLYIDSDSDLAIGCIEVEGTASIKSSSGKTITIKNADDYSPSGYGEGSFSSYYAATDKGLLLKNGSVLTIDTDEDFIIELVDVAEGGKAEIKSVGTGNIMIEARTDTCGELILSSNIEGRSNISES